MSRANEVLSLVVADRERGIRLDRFLADRVPAASRTQLQRLIREGAVRLNGELVQPAARVAPGDSISVLLCSSEEPGVPANPQLRLDVVFSDEHIVVVDKPAGQVVHPAAGHKRDTLVNALLARFPQLSDAFGDSRPGIVHRLDRDTSGVMVIALTEAAAASLRAQFKSRSVEKLYVALVQGLVDPPQGVVDAPIGRDPSRRMRMAAVVGGRPAQTVYRTVSSAEDYAWLEIEPKTGRTHQIRVHMSAIGHPVVGDEVYGRSDPLIARMALHARLLEFDHPATGERRGFAAPLPRDIRDALEKLGIEPD